MASSPNAPCLLPPCQKECRRACVTAMPSFQPDANEEYLRPAYWNERFTQEDEYEWFKGYGAFQEIMQRHLNPLDRVLVVGCGNSRMSEEMAEDIQLSHVVSVDISPVVVEKMRGKSISCGHLSHDWVVGDMLRLPFAGSSFDVVVEKGAMDVLLVDCKSQWQPGEAARGRVMAMLSNIHHVLSPSGVFISITFGQPHFRRQFFEAPEFSWAMEYDRFGEAFHYFVYHLRKGSRMTASPRTGREEDDRVRAIAMEHEFMDGDDFLLRSELGL
eukprot:TRINITY_DN2069_c0_g1_i4.p1 TRINITY_DN2069_c0_g1~~TRINITY_DN2069_c0_g1_i4.p1  ORF type:complete len:272 (-),score=45.93 TRINITY_DN2069_c0_g1_i4:100-915(-)